MRDTQAVSAGPSQIALSGVIGGLSYALDLTEGEPPGHAVRTCKIGMRLAQALGLDSATRSHLFYALLLKDAGCSANSARMAALFGADDHVAKRTSKRVNWAHKFPAFMWSLRTVAPGGSPRARADRLLAIKREGEVTRALMLARCERGAEIAYMLGLHADTAEAIRTLDEHWDGGGQPRGLRGEQIPPLGRILCFAQTVEIFHGAGGVAAARRVARRRRGGWFEPALVDCAGRDPRRRGVLGNPGDGRRPVPLGADGSPPDRRRGATGPDHRRIRGCRRREVAVDIPAFRSRLDDRDGPRPRARLRSRTP